MALISGNVLIDLLGVFVALVAVAVVYVKWSLKYWDRRGIPCEPPTFLLGNAKDLVLHKKNLGETFARTYNTFKYAGHKYAGSYFFTTPILVVNDPELIKNIMTKDFDHFVDRGMYVNEKTDPLSAHLFNLAGTKWRNLRVKLTPTFTSGKMKMMFQTLVDCSDGLTKLVEELGDSTIEIKDVVGRYTTDVIGSCAFGLDCNTLTNPDSEFRYYGKKFFSPNAFFAIKSFAAGICPKVLQFFNARVIAADVSDFFLNVVKETIEYREKNNIKRKDFMNLLLQLKNTGKLEGEDEEHHTNGKSASSDSFLTFEEIAAQSFVFFVAGFETSSTTLTFCFYELTKNMDVQEKLRNEINQVLARHEGKITYEALMEMKYMDNVINETLRKYPPVPTLPRITTKEYNLPEMNLHIPVGQSVFIPVLGIQHDPEHYPDPEKFDPDRFTEEGKKTRHPYTFLPFGEGPRVCIGARFGIMQTKVPLTVLLKDFKFTLNAKTKEPFVMDPKSIITSVADGVWFNASKINA